MIGFKVAGRYELVEYLGGGGMSKNEKSRIDGGF